MAGMVIAGFAGIGKTTLAKKYKNVVDIESSLYKWDNSGLEDVPVEARKGMKRNENKEWPLNYINEIKDKMEKYDIVLVWIKPDVLELYEKYNIKYTLCYPKEEALPIYEQRYRDRGNSEEYINKVINSFEKTKKKFDEKNVDKIILKGNETLEDYLINVGVKLIEKE